MHVHLIDWGPEQLITAVEATDADFFVYKRGTLKAGETGSMAPAGAGEDRDRGYRSGR
ncbi:hypothetical protein [Sorangium sp. So ce1182]|uniref:hypothetical protein n=1 Tax=Sorangium sp. So ce1182 TaxID=3133334 RepID=UPI003F60F174